MSVLAALPMFLAAEGQETFESHSGWWPETLEIIWGGLAFLIVAGALVKFAGPAMKTMLADRTAKVQKELDDATADKAAAEAEVSRVKANLRDLDADKARILAEARASADRMRAEGMARNDAEMAELEARAAADLEAAHGRVQTEIAAQVAELSGDAADRIVRQLLDEATQRDLVEQYIATVGASR